MRQKSNNGPINFKEERRKTGTGVLFQISASGFFPQRQPPDLRSSSPNSDILSYLNADGDWGDSSTKSQLKIACFFLCRFPFECVVVAMGAERYSEMQSCGELWSQLQKVLQNTGCACQLYRVEYSGYKSTNICYFGSSIIVTGISLSSEKSYLSCVYMGIWIFVTT